MTEDIQGVGGGGSLVGNILPPYAVSDNGSTGTPPLSPHLTKDSGSPGVVFP